MQREADSYVLSRVFVPGGLPTVTYVPRADRGLEQHVLEYLDERHRILSLSGPTKSGKTVLLRSIIADPNTAWVSGGQIGGMADFWSILGDITDVATEQTVETSQSASQGSQRAGEVSAAPLGLGLRGSHEAQAATTTEMSSTARRARALPVAVRDALLDRMAPLVLDDFHYISPEVQLEIVRNLKDPVFRGLPVILASVPHRAYDAVRVEREMTGRVEQLPISFWSQHELTAIAEEGFSALGVSDADRLRDRLATESFQSPHLMQDFCLQLCKDNGVRETVYQAVNLVAPQWEHFFKERASAASKTAFDLLARGPRQRSDRIERRLRTGESTDIYGAVLVAIAATGPLTQLTYEELRASLRDVLASEPPQRHEVTRVLEEMSRIAKDQIEGEPVVDYDGELATLFISDPFFAYYLRWAIRPS